MTPAGENYSQLALEHDGRTKKQRRHELERRAYAIPCPKCGASSREVCTSLISGEAAARMHAARVRQATYS